MNKIKVIIIGLSVYQLVFGLFSLFMTLRFFFLEDSINLLPLVLYGISVLAALELLFKHKFRFTILNQFLQLIQFKIGLSGFYFINGFYIGVGINNTNNLESILDFEWSEVTCMLHINQEPEVYMVVINLTSVAILGIVYFIETKRKSILQEKNK